MFSRPCAMDMGAEVGCRSRQGGKWRQSSYGPWPQASADSSHLCGVAFDRIRGIVRARLLQTGRLT